MGVETMSILNFAPENRFYDKIRDGIKIGTIRDKPKVVGETLHLWEKKRGMRKGWYCPECFKLLEPTADFEMSLVAPCPFCKSKKERVFLPRKIAEKKCTACILIKMLINGSKQMVEFFRKHLKEGVWETRYWIRW